MVEYSLAKAGVEGSSPFFRLQNCVLWSFGYLNMIRGHVVKIILITTLPVFRVDDLLVGYRLSPITVSGTAIGKADHPTSRFLRLILIPRDFENLRIIDARSTIDSYS